MELPVFKKSSTDMAEPSWANERNVMLLPMLKTLHKDKLWMEPRVANPCTLMLEPARQKLRIDNAEPQLMKSNTDKWLPNLA
jgi:hypothetical protein